MKLTMLGKSLLSRILMDCQSLYFNKGQGNEKNSFFNGGTVVGKCVISATYGLKI